MVNAVEPRFNELLFNELLDITNDILCPNQSYSETYEVEPRYNQPLFKEVLDITNNILCTGQSYSKMWGIEPRYNEFFDIANIIRSLNVKSTR